MEKIVAVGTLAANYVKVYQYDDIDTWIQMGSKILGTPGAFGTSVSLSSDGTIVAVGAPKYSPNNWTNQTGLVRIYNYVNNKLDTNLVKIL